MELIQDALHPRLFEKPLNIRRITIELLQRRGRDRSLPGGAGIAVLDRAMDRRDFQILLLLLRSH